MSEAIAVRLPNWLGDTVMAVPAVRALRRGFPDARMLLAGPWAWLLAEPGLADSLLPYPRGWAARLRTADVVNRFAPSIALLLPNSLESALAAWCWGARRRVGFARGGRGPLLTEAIALPEPRRHQVDEYLLLAERCGGVVEEREPRLTPPAEDTTERLEARALLQSAGVSRSGGARVVGIHLGAAYGPSKLWPQARVAELCQLVGREGATALLLGAPAEAAAAAAVTARAPAANLVGRDRPALLPALLAELDVVVSGDTGVAHLAAALGTPAVTLFGPTDPALTAPRGPARALVNPVPCAPCFYRVCPIDHPCLRDLDAARVLDAAWAVSRRAA